MERGNRENEFQMGQQENVPPNNQNVPRNNRPDSSTSPSTSRAAKSIPMKKRKIKTEEVNQMHRDAYNSMECNAMYMQQRAQALQGRNSVIKRESLSPSSSSSSSSSGDGPRTPSPDFAPSASHASSPFVGSSRHVRQPAEHNYAASSSSSSTATADSSPAAAPARARLEPAGPPLITDTDSANSSLNDSINPLCISDWYKDLLTPEYAAKLRAEHEVITSRSHAQKTAIIDAKVAELPPGPDYYPNKSRLRKEYDDPEQAAERVRNNQASRLSRFKKKRAQIVLNFQLEYDRNENAYLYAMQNWIEKVIFQLEARWLQQGASGQDLLRLRRECGFPGEIEPVEWLQPDPIEQSP